MINSKQVLEAYVTDKSFREIIDNKKFAELNTHPSGEFFSSPEVINILKKILIYKHLITKQNDGLIV